MDPDRTLFAAATRDALASLHDTARLQINPLVGWLGIGATETGAAAALREVLQETILALRPGAGVPGESPAWLTYQIFRQRYILGKSRFIICDELSLGQATYYRYHRQGLEAVEDILWRSRYQPTLSANAEPADDLVSAPQDAKSWAFTLAMRSRPEIVPLADLLVSGVEMISPLLIERHVQIELDIAVELPLLYGDPAIIRQIFLYTLAWAVDHTATGGLRVALGNASGAILLSVAGLRRAGMDLLDSDEGLRDSRRLLEAYRGTIEFVDTATGAATLDVSIPTRQPATILIIDDDADTIQLYCRYLQGRNYMIEVAQSADQARLFIHARPQVILLDILMAKEDGWDILRYVRSEPATADIPIIICSVLSQPELALAMGASSVLKKPISEHDLVAAIEAAMPRVDSEP